MISMVDPRGWNLLAGLTLLGGCGGRTASGEGASGTEGTASSSEGTASASSSESSGDECSIDADCPPGYYCIGGVCDYQIAPDGQPWYECYDIDECGPLALCVEYMCEFSEELGGCEPSAAQPIPRSIDGTPLALSFVDLDADGADEIVVATGDEFYAFASDVMQPVSSLRQHVSPSIEGMVAGAFDQGAGQDLTLIAANFIATHPSDGVSGFGMPSLNMLNPLGQLRGLSAAEADMNPGTEILVWGTAGAGVLDADTVSFLTSESVHAGTARSPSLDNVAYVLRLTGELRFHDAAGSPIASTSSYASGEEPLVSLQAGSEALELDAAVLGANLGQPWTSLRLLALEQQRGHWGVDGSVIAMAAGDLDGDGDDELALLLDGGVVVLVQNVGGAACTLALMAPPLAMYLATGDWDGDGDDELAIASQTGELLIYDDV